MDRLVTLERTTPGRRSRPERPDASRSRVTGPRPARRRVYIETYGCQMNINDTELIEGLLADRGYLAVDDASRADVVLVNTCAIREHAEQRVIGRIGQLQQHRRANPDLLLGITGCMAQRLGPRLLEESAGVDLVAGPDAYRGLGALIDGMLDGGLERGQLALELDSGENYEGVTSVRRDGVSAWVTVQRGCDHRCTFCIVPYVRGGEKNREPEAILAEVRDAVAAGFPEIVLLGQTVNSYRSGARDFAWLLREVARVDGVRRVRFTSPHPNDVTVELLRVMEEEGTVCRQLHLPVQSGSDRVLKRMVRRYTRESFLGKVRLARERVPGIALSTDVIVAFPGETEAEYEETLDLMREVRFDDAYLYRYSPREGTPATRLPAGEFIDDETGSRRLERLIEVHREIQRQINESEVGRIERVLVERPARSSGDMLGRTEASKVVAFPGGEDLVGRFVDVRLVSTTGATFRGQPVEAGSRCA